MHAARQLLLTCFANAEPIHLGGEERGDHRVDTFLVSEADDGRAYQVLSFQIGADFVPDIVSEYPHVPYSMSLANAKPPRWHATTWLIRSRVATRARFVQRRVVREAAVVAGHCVLHDCDTPWLAAESRPRPAALLVDAPSTPTLSGLVAATAEDFRRGYLAHHRADANDRNRYTWARDAFYESRNTAGKIALVEAILDGNDLPGGVLDELLAGTVEDMIGHQLLDHVATSGERRALWHKLLRIACRVDEPPDVRKRLVALFGDPPR